MLDIRENYDAMNRNKDNLVTSNNKKMRNRITRKHAGVSVPLILSFLVFSFDYAKNLI